MTHTRNRCRVKIEDTAPQMTMADVLRERLRLNPPDQQVVWNNCFTRQTVEVMTALGIPPSEWYRLLLSTEPTNGETTE